MNERTGHTVDVGDAPAFRVMTLNQLARALQARTSHIIIWDTHLARPFARLLWARWFPALADLLTGSISREYGVKFGSEWKIARHIDGEIILTLDWRPGGLR
jgi:hypothetical protein